MIQFVVTLVSLTGLAFGLLEIICGIMHVYENLN